MKNYHHGAGYYGIPLFINLYWYSPFSERLSGVFFVAVITAAQD